MQPMQCPRFDSCSAPVCPLDSNWQSVPHLHGERACFWLMEIGKRGGEASVATRLRGEVFEKVSQVHPELSYPVAGNSTQAGEAHSQLLYKLREAWKTGSRIESANRLNKQPQETTQ
jgi:hypothetical protein